MAGGEGRVPRWLGAYQTYDPLVMMMKGDWVTLQPDSDKVETDSQARPGRNLVGRPKSFTSGSSGSQTKDRRRRHMVELIWGNLETGKVGVDGGGTVTRKKK